jgi:ubiquitin-protein ligase
MSFLLNFFYSPKEQEPKQEKHEEKNVPDLNDFAFDFDTDKKKEIKFKNDNNKNNTDSEPIEEIIKDEKNIIIEEKEEEKQKEQDKVDDNDNNNINKEKEKEKEEIQNNNNENIQHHPKKVKKKKGTKGKKAKHENKEEKIINIIKEEKTEITIQEKNIDADDNTTKNIILEKADNPNQNNQIIEIQINKEDTNNKKIILEGPENSPYENGKFELSINYENDNLKPILKFITKIYHYNIAQKNGEILCPFIWNKNNNEEENIKNIKTLLLRPDTRFPCSKFIKDEYYNNYQSYKEKAQKFTENYAMN